MTVTALLNQLANYQAEAIKLCQRAGDEYRQQFHPDLSPVGWHLGHCIFTETYWIHEKFLEDDACSDDLHQLYNPLNNNKDCRGDEIPELDSLIQWAQKAQAGNIQTIEKHQHRKDPMELMQNNFLLHFLVQHYAQHLETIKLVFTQSEKLKLIGKEKNGVIVDQQHQLKMDTRLLHAGEYIVGSRQEHMPYDNEYPSHTFKLQQSHIMTRPVSNADYRCFIADDGYENSAHWSDAGQAWLQKNTPGQPVFWHRNRDNSWSVIHYKGVTPLIENNPVYGLSHYEAEAFANWTGGRLPHEHEWEIARNLGLLENTGKVWEWCANSFFPYEGFNAYPYEGYSTPYFDGKHYTLKGGSILSKSDIKRPHFRNYYQQDKNFLYAGLRLVFDQQPTQTAI